MEIQGHCWSVTTPCLPASLTSPWDISSTCNTNPRHPWGPCSPWTVAYSGIDGGSRCPGRGNSLTTPSPFPQSRGCQMPLTLPRHLRERQGAPPPTKPLQGTLSQGCPLPETTSSCVSDGPGLCDYWGAGAGWRMVFPARPGEWLWLRSPNCKERLERSGISQEEFSASFWNSSGEVRLGERSPGEQREQKGKLD